MANKQPILQKEFNETIRKKLQKKLKIDNVHAVPEIKKVVLNVGAGEAMNDKKIIDNVVEDLRLISGQKPVVALARKSVSAFKIRKGHPIGAKVTLRRKNMYFFLEKLFKIVLPRIRDFRGIPSKSLDGHGNLNIGISDQTLFPEVEYDKIDKIRGLEITLVTSARTDDEARALFEELGLIFNDQNE